MYNILIVDDDYLFRSFLRNFIDYKKYNCSVFYEAENGKTALEIIKNEPVHIVITDMSMPVMNGVQLIREAKHLKKEIVFIALSSFEDFDYVKESMKNGAIDYLLKHRISEDYLIDILRKAQEKLDELKVSIHTNNIEKYQKNLSVEFVRHLVLEGSGEDKDKTDEFLIKLVPGINPTRVTLLLMEIDNIKALTKKWETPKQQNHFLTQVIDICQHIIDDMLPGIVAQIDNSRIVIVFSNESEVSEKNLFEKTNQVINRIKNSIKKFLNITCCIAISSICRDISKLDDFYHEVLEKMTLKFYEGHNKVFYENPPIDKCGILNIGDIDLSEIKFCFSNYKFGEIMEIVKKTFNAFFEDRCKQEVVMAAAFELIGIIVATCHDFLINVEDLYEGNLPYTQIQEAETFEQIKSIIFSLYDKAFDQIKMRKLPPEYSEVTKKAVLYLFSNYMNAVSLEDVAGFIGVNNAYLSRVFKKDTGRGFIEYLNIFRIDVSKRLIMDDREKLKDIALKTGFTSYNYFFKIFKEITGLTPQEFKNANIIGQET